MDERIQPRLDLKKHFAKEAVKFGGALLSATMAGGLMAGCSSADFGGGPERPTISQTESYADRAERQAREKVLKQINNPEQVTQIIAEPLVVTEKAKQRSAADKLIPQNLNPEYESDQVVYETKVQSVVNSVNAIQNPQIKNEARAYLEGILAEGVVGYYFDYNTYEGGNHADDNKSLVSERRGQAELIGSTDTKTVALAMLDLNLAQSVGSANKPTKDSEALKGLITSEEYRDLAVRAANGDKDVKDKLDKSYSDLKTQLDNLLKPGKETFLFGGAWMTDWVNQDLAAYKAAREATPGDKIPAYKDVARVAVNAIKDSKTLQTAEDTLPLIPSAEVQDQMKNAVDDAVLGSVSKLRLSSLQNIKDVTKQVNDTLLMVNGMYSSEARSVAGSLLADKLAELYVANYSGADKDAYYQGLLVLFDTMPDKSYKELSVKIKGGADKTELTNKGNELSQSIQKLPTNGADAKLYAGSNGQARTVNYNAEMYLKFQ